MDNLPSSNSIQKDNHGTKQNIKLTEIQLMNQHFILKFLSLKGVFAKNKREKIVKKNDTYRRTQRQYKFRKLQHLTHSKIYLIPNKSLGYYNL